MTKDKNLYSNIYYGELSSMFEVPNFIIEGKIISIFKDNHSNIVDVRYVIAEKDIERLEKSMESSYTYQFNIKT